VVDGDKVTFDGGNRDAMEELMESEKIEKMPGPQGWYKTPPGWLAKYLEKNGPDKLYNGEGESVIGYQRPKK
jgi:hypothetical protein